MGYLPIVCLSSFLISFTLCRVILSILFKEHCTPRYHHSELHLQTLFCYPMVCVFHEHCFCKGDHPIWWCLHCYKLSKICLSIFSWTIPILWKGTCDPTTEVRNFIHIKAKDIKCNCIMKLRNFFCPKRLCIGIEKIWKIYWAYIDPSCK